ncbi:MAG: helix-turn-helix domain-containing protein [bacterium]
MNRLSPHDIKRIRLNLGLTQEELAHNLGVAVSTVNRWENSKNRPGKMACKLLLNMKSQADSPSEI